MRSTREGIIKKAATFSGGGKDDEAIYFVVL